MTDERPTWPDILTALAGAGTAVHNAVGEVQRMLADRPDGPAVISNDGGGTVVLNISGDVSPETLEAAVRMAADVGQGKAPVILAGPEDLVSQVRYVPGRIPVDVEVMARVIERARKRREAVGNKGVSEQARRAEATLAADLVTKAMRDGVTTVDRGDVMSLLQSREVGSMHVEDLDLYRAAKFG